jgi:hypothetical protein
MTISGNINQTNGTITTSSSNINLNGNVIINPTKSLSCGAISSTSINNSGSYNAISCTSINNSGTLTQSAVANFSNDIKVNSGQSVYITNSGLTNFLRMHHSGAAAYIDFIGVLNFRNSTTNPNNPTDTFNINNTTNQGTFSYNLNTTGIINNTNAITNNAALYQNSNATFSNVIVAPGIKSNSAAFYCGSYNDFDSTAISSPKIINGIASGNGDGASYTQFNLAINSWQGVGFLYSNPAGPSVCKLVIDNRSGNLSTLGTISCNNINLNYTTLPTFTSSMVGYQTSFVFSSSTNITSGINYTLFSFTLPIGVWNIQTGIVFLASSGNVTINKFTLTHYKTDIVLDINMNNQAISIDSSYNSFYKNSFIYQNTISSIVEITYTQQTYTGSGLQISADSNSYVKITRIA